MKNWNNSTIIQLHLKTCFFEEDICQHICVFSVSFFYHMCIDVCGCRWLSITFFQYVKQAETVCRRMAGEYYDGKMELIRQDDAVTLCREHPGRLFIKPSVYSGCGRGIKEFDPSACADGTIRELFEETGVNFIVQEKIKQHASLASLNPDSVNTVRI